MDEGGGCLLAALGFVAAILAVWTALAAAMHVLAWVLVFWIATLALGIAVGILVSLVLPVRVLLGKTSEQPELATPDAVVAGKVLGPEPKGPARHFGWDRAWPVYNPYQAGRDRRAVLDQARRTTTGAFGRLSDLEPVLLSYAVLLPAFVGFSTGIWVSTVVWYLVMSLFGFVMHGGQFLGAFGYRSYDRLVRRQRKATLRCAKSGCYRTTTTPSYRCSNESCSTVHHDIRPGPLGVVRRRCGCGVRLPTTVGRASKRLVTVCPYCDTDAPQGSGLRRVLPIPVIGAVGAGKTQFLCSGVAGLGDRMEALSGSLAPMSAAAELFIATAEAAISSGKHVEKTAWEAPPEGLPVLLDLNGRQIEVQLMDAAGEHFVDWERSQGLSYIDSSDILVLILDPFSLPIIGEQMRIAGKADAVPIAQGDPDDAYASVVDRLRAQDVPLGSKRIAVVLTKLDVLQALPSVDAIDPSDASAVKGWLRANGADALVRRLSQDFKQVDYFAVDSYGVRDTLSASHPVRVLDWALTLADSRFALVSRVTTVAEVSA